MKTWGREFQAEGTSRYKDPAAGGCLKNIEESEWESGRNLQSLKSARPDLFEDLRVYWGEGRGRAGF